MAGGERIPGTPRYRHHLLENPGTEPFFPNFLLKEWIAGAVFLMAFMLWVMFNPVPDGGGLANPQDTSFIPVPDWYFLFLYQILKYYPGSDITIGVVLVPFIGTLLLIAVPWLDIRKSRHPYKRPLATGGIVLATFLTIWLTNEASVQHNAELAAANGTAPLSAGLVVLPKIPASQIHLVDTSDPGYKIFENQCATCHGQSAQGIIGPPIYAIGAHWDYKKILGFVNKGMGAMPAKGGLTSETQVQSVVKWLSKQKG